ncbi:hypothetical protein F5146DRAFT_1060094 [Armillaria mellea]|nr:hypothetical protein F5146DRAFT_1060094 [Armillaria mellea]
MSYDQSNPRRDDEYNSPVADDSYASRNTNVQSQNCRASSDDNATSYSNSFNSGINEEARHISEPSDTRSGYTGEDSSMSTGPIRYESYMPGPGDEAENDSTSHDITSSHSDLYKDHDECAGRGPEAQRYDAGSSNTGSHDDFSTGDIGQPISNGYDSGFAGWARENSVPDDSRSTSRGYAGDSSSSSASAVGDSVTSCNAGDNVGRADRNIGTSVDSDSRDSADDIRDRNNAGSRDESGRAVMASTFEEATGGYAENKSAENTGSVSDGNPSINTSTTSDAPDTDNSSYKGSGPTGGSTHTSRDDSQEATDTNDYGRSPYDATKQSISSDGQTLPIQRGPSTLGDDQQVRDTTIDTSETSREDVDNTRVSTFDDQPSANEEQTSSSDAQRERDMTPDTAGQDRSATTNYGKSPYNAADSVRDSRSASSDGRPSSAQSGSSSLHHDQQGRDATTAKSPKANLDSNDVSTLHDQTSPESDIRSNRDDAEDHGSYDQLKKSPDTSEAPSGYTGDKSAKNTASDDLGADTLATTDDVTDESKGRKDSSATRRDDTEKGTQTDSSFYDGNNIRRESHTTSDVQPSFSEQTSSTAHDQEQGGIITTSAPREDVDNDGPSSFDDRSSFGKEHWSDDARRDHDAAATTGTGPGSRDDISNRGGPLHVGPHRGPSEGQDASSTGNVRTEDVDNTNLDEQNENDQTGRVTASDTTGQDVGSKREDASIASDRSTSGADQPPDTIGYSGEQADNKPYRDDSAGAGYDHSGYGGYAASTGYRAGSKAGLKDKLRGNAEVLVGRAAKKPELVERGLERKAGNVV